MVKTIISKEEAYFIITQKRSDEEKRSIKLLEKYFRTLIHSYFKSYINNH
jgi:hypothetical protein